MRRRAHAICQPDDAALVGCTSAGGDVLAAAGRRYDLPAASRHSGGKRIGLAGSLPGWPNWQAVRGSRGDRLGALSARARAIREGDMADAAPLAGKLALVTGAGMGIGQGIALELARQ